MAPGSTPSSRGPQGPHGPGGPNQPARRSALGGGAGRSTPPPVGSTRASARAAAAGTARRAPAGRRRLIDYPRQGKRGIRRWLPSWRLVLGTFLFVVALGVGALVAAYVRTDIPTPDDFAEAQTTTVYYADGATPMGTFGVQNRVLVDGATIPDHVKQAVVAGEDRSFYENPGINPTGIARALWTNLRGGQRQGGSSITQQYAERYYIGQTVGDYRGKLREAMLAIKLDRQQDKDEILSNYLNTIYFGRDSYGIETAAHSYFNVAAKDLTVSQAALLAGVIPSPNNFDPRVSPEQAERRWNYVLDGMVATGALTQADRDAQTFPETVEYSRSDIYAGPQGYLLDMVRQEILDRSTITEDELNTRGYKIVSSIDLGLQQMALETIQNMASDHAPNLREALVTLAPQDGAILALYGGPDFVSQPRNAVTQDTAQAGSTFKPFTLTAYLEKGGSLKSRYSGANKFPMKGFTDDVVRNFGGESFGKIDLVQATAQSVNAVYAQLNEEVGPAATLDVAKRAGVNEKALEGQEVVANVLGTAAPHPLDMAQAYNTFNAGGVRTEPFIVRSVEYLDGSGVAYQGGSAPEQVFDPAVMADVTYAMTQVVEDRHGTARKAQAVGYPVAGKTGTSNENKSAWFVGFTRQLTTAIALYQVGPAPDNAVETITPFGGYREITGGSVPADMWTDYMTKAMAGREVLPFPERADVGKPNTPPLVDVPSVVGMAEAEARSTLEGAGFSVGVEQANDPNVPEGTVISQNPAGGQAEQGSGVTIVVSSGPGTATVPSVTGMDAGAAQAALQAAGLTAGVSEKASDKVPVGKVISQDPAAGTEVPAGSTVGIVVSTGPAAKPEPEPTPTPTPTAPPADGGTQGLLPGPPGQSKP